jgi:hypothetical protein
VSPSTSAADAKGHSAGRTQALPRSGRSARTPPVAAPDPDYHFWNGGKDVGPKGTDAVRTYYSWFIGTQTNVLEFALDRLVVDDHCVVTEGFLKQIYPGAYAAPVGIEVDDESTDYLVVNRQLILWPVDADGLIGGEDSYQSGPVSVTKIAFEDLPRKYVDMVHISA